MTLKDPEVLLQGTQPVPKSALTVEVSPRNTNIFRNTIQTLSTGEYLLLGVRLSLLDTNSFLTALLPFLLQ
jgi:hypothetical protein